jgi:hypothetical protein
MKKPELLAALLLIASFFAGAQTDYHDVPGFYVSDEGDSINGVWELRSLSSTLDSLMLYEFQTAPKFKSNDGKTKEIKPEDGNRRVGYQYHGQWRTWYRVDRKNELDNIGPRGEFLFAQRELIGKIEVFGIIIKSFSDGESINKGTDKYVSQHIFHKKGTTKAYYLERLNYQGYKVKDLVRDCPAALEWYKANESGMADNKIYELARFYNQKCP